MRFHHQTSNEAGGCRPLRGAKTSVKIETTFLSSESGLSWFTSTRPLTAPVEAGQEFFFQIQQDSDRSVTRTDEQPWAPGRGAASPTSSPTRRPSLWWSRAGRWASSTGLYSCSSSRILLGQWLMFKCLHILWVIVISDYLLSSPVKIIDFPQMSSFTCNDILY